MQHDRIGGRATCGGEVLSVVYKSVKRILGSCGGCRWTLLSDGCEGYRSQEEDVGDEGDRQEARYAREGTKK